MGNNLLKSLGISDSDMLHRVIGSTFIVEYGIIKAIPAKGIVTVEMSVAESANDIIITNCVLASFASSSFTVNIKPNIDDKVIVLFPRCFVGKMFNPDNNEPIMTDCGNGYTIMGGIAILMNQYQEKHHKNYIDVSDGEITLVSKDVQLTTNKDSEITVKNGKATITVDKSGNVKIDANGKYTIKNGVTSLKEVTDGLAQELENLTTTGSQTAQSTSPASKATIANWRLSKLNQFFS